MPLHTRCGYIFSYPQHRIAISKVGLGILSTMGNLSKQQNTHSTQYTHNTQLNLTIKYDTRPRKVLRSYPPKV